MKYIYQSGCTIGSPYKSIRFTKDNSVESVTKNYLQNERIFEITYPEGATFSQIPGAEVEEDNPIDLEGDVKLYERHTVNGMTFTLHPNKTGYIWSCFLDCDSTEITYEENEIGGWVIIPATEIPNDVTSQVVEVINKNSTLFHVESDKFVVSNIPAVDMAEDKVKESYDNVIPYGSYPRIYLTEADIIAAFIRECKSKFPEIEFFPQSSERKNLGKESIFYRAQISQDKSNRFNSNLLEDFEGGRLFQTTIPVELHYQTSDIKQYVNRRNSYLLCNFLMDVHTFKVTKQRGYPDRYGNVEEVFEFATYWDRNAAQDELVKADAPDGSGRDTYTLYMPCDLIGFIIEKSKSAIPIRQVITNIYVNTVQISTRINTK